MTIVTGPVERPFQGLVAEDFPVTFARGFMTSVADNFIRSAGPSSVRSNELEQAEFGPQGSAMPAGSFVNLRRRAMGLEPLPQDEIDRRVGLSDMLTADQARARIGDLPLEIPAAGIRSDVLDILIDSKTEELRRANVLARASLGATIPGALLGAMADPVNIPLAFVPVVGQARFAAMARQVGVTGARLGRGAVEGLVGAAVIEPVVLAAAGREQADYDMLDSLINVAFGTGVGGGLHLAGGFGADIARAATGRASLAAQLNLAPAASREALLRTAVAQAAEGRLVDVMPVIRSDPGLAFDRLVQRAAIAGDAPRARSIAEAPEPGEFALGPASGKAGQFREYTPPRPGDRAWIEGVVAELEQTRSGQRQFVEVDGQGSTPEVIGVKADTPQWFQRVNREIAAEQGRVTAERRQRRTMSLEEIQARGELAPAPAALTRRAVRDTALKLLEGKPLSKRQGDIAAIIMDEARAARVTNAGQIVDFRAERSLRRAERQAIEDAEIDRIAAEEEEFWKRDSAIDIPAMEEVERLVADVPREVTAERAGVEAELAELTEELDRALAAGELGAEDVAALEASRVLAAEADAEAKGYRAGVACLSRG